MAYACLAAGACLVVGWVLPTSVAFSNATLAALAVSGLMLAAIVVRYFRTGRDLLDPLIVISASLIFYFGIHTLWLAANPGQAQDSIAFPFAAGLAPSLALLGAGYVLLLFGFSVPRTALRGRATRRPWYSRRALIGVFAIGMAGNIAAAASGGYAKTDLSAETGSNLLIYKTLGFVAIVALVVTACQNYTVGERNASYRRTMWLMLGVLVVFALSVAEKQIAFSAIFAWVAARNYTHSHVRVRQVLLVIALALFVVTPIVQASRGIEALQTVGSQANLGSVETTSANIPQRIKKYVAEFPIDALSGFNIINSRTNGSESLALAYLYTPSKQGFRYGTHWPDIFTSLVPHFLWPGKPVHNDTRQFSEAYAGQAADSGRGLTVAPTLPGDFYMNFGWPGILGGMFVFGILIKLVTNASLRHSSSVGTAIYVSAMLALVLVEQTTADIGSTALLQLLATALAFGLMRVASEPWTMLLPKARYPALRATTPSVASIEAKSSKGGDR